MKAVLQLFEFDKDFESKLTQLFMTKYSDVISEKLARDIINFNLNFIKTHDLELVLNHFNIQKLINEQVVQSLKYNLKNLNDTELDSEFVYIISAFNQSNIIAIPSKLISEILNNENLNNKPTSALSTYTERDEYIIERSDNEILKSNNENKKNKSKSKLKNEKIKSKRGRKKVNIEVDYKILNTKNSMEEFEKYNMNGIEIASMKASDVYIEYLKFCKLNKMFPQNILIFGKYFTKIYDVKQGTDGTYYLNVRLKK